MCQCNMFCAAFLISNVLFACCALVTVRHDASTCILNTTSSTQGLIGLIGLTDRHRRILTDRYFLGFPGRTRHMGKPEALMECPSLRSYMIYHDPTFDSLPSLASGKNKLVTFASKISNVVTFRRRMKDGDSIWLQWNSIWFLTRIRPWFFQKVIDQRRGRGAKKGSKGILSGTCCRYCVRSHLQFFFKINGRNLALVTTLPETNK